MLSEDRPEQAELIRNSREYHVDIAAASIVSRAKEGSSEFAGFVIVARDGLSDSRLSSPSDAVEPEDLASRIAVGLHGPICRMSLGLEPAMDSIQDLGPCIDRTRHSFGLLIKSCGVCVSWHKPYLHAIQ